MNHFQIQILKSCNYFKFCNRTSLTNPCQNLKMASFHSSIFILTQEFIFFEIMEMNFT